MDPSPLVSCDHDPAGAFYSLGATLVTCTVSDASGNSSSASFTITVEDTTPPSLVGMPGDVTVEGNTVGGAYYAYTDPTATDIVDANPTVDCSPDSGFFALGTTTVTCTATDASGNFSSDSFDVTVIDTTAPTLIGMPTDMTVEGNTTGGANVTWTDPTATDIVDPSPSVACAPVSGSFFALGGPHTVTCTATDASGNFSTDSFDVTVVDTTAPTLHNMPTNMTVEGNTTGGANVTWTDPTATDIVDPSPSVACAPVSGSFFALGGPHTATCTATDASSNSASDSFNITVVDTTPPNIICPADFNGTVGQPVSLGSPTVSDIVDASPTVSNDAPGSFPPGSTFVHWTATDHSGNAASCTQKVTLLYNWTGFFQPVDNPTTVNIAKAGSSIPVKFNLGGYQGLNIFAVTPYVSLYQCGTVPGDEIETYTAGNSSLTYDFTAQHYVYVWKTEKSYVPRCGVLHVKLIDGTDHTANFKFK